MPRPNLGRVPVSGGDYCVARWPGRGPTLLAVHGLTASHLSWSLVVDQLRSGVAVVAPDLRGRGGSSSLPGPCGLSAHAGDLLRTLDHLGIDEVVVAGHSLGAFIGLEFARQAPERTRGVVLVDGGIAFPLPPATDPDAALKGLLGPALARLEMTFESRSAYREYWRAHPSFGDAGAWNAAVEAYVDYDLVGDEPTLRSRVSAAAVRDDCMALLSNEVATLINQVRAPMLLLTATRGLLNQPVPLLPEALVRATLAAVPHLQWRGIPDTNHYTITLGAGAAAVAGAIDAFVAAV